MKVGLQDIDPGDVEDTIIELEKSLNIVFANGELEPIETFGDLCDKVSEKINCSNANDCTKQQAFYLLRKACIEQLGVPRKQLRIDTPLALILNRENRKQKIRKLEQQTG
jgi:hypothetical protein